MRQLRLLAAVLAVTMLGASAVSFACDKDKSAQAAAVTASAKSAVCTPAMAAKCTPEMAAACKAAKSGAATTAVAGYSATTVGMEGCGEKSANASACAGHQKVSATAVGADHCGGMKSASGHSCGVGAKNSTTALHKCNGAGMLSAAGGGIHEECDACHDMADCGAELDAAGARSQVVSLKNGVIFVYTATSPAQVRAVQAALVRRTERINALVSAGDKAKLCDECKLMRGAMASGKLQREVVNVEGGCLTLMTSSDPKVVERIHSLVDSRLVASRTKS